MRASLIAVCRASSAAFLAGCAGSSAPFAAESSVPTSTASSGDATFSYLGPVSTASTLDDGDIHLNVPATGAVAAVSPQKAFAVCASGQGVCTTSSKPTIRLALVTTTAAGTAGPSGSIDPRINNALTYVIEWSNTPCPASAGPQGPSELPSATLTTKVCELVDFVSADTGTYLYAFQSAG